MKYPADLFDWWTLCIAVLSIVITARIAVYAWMTGW